MGRKKKSRDYLNMDIPFDQLVKPRTKKEKDLYMDRKCTEMAEACKDMMDDSFDEDFSDEKFTDTVTNGLSLVNI